MYCLPCAPVDHQLLGVSYTLAFRAVSFLYFDALFKLCHPFMFAISYMIIIEKVDICFEVKVSRKRKYNFLKERFRQNFCQSNNNNWAKVYRIVVAD